jgi:hypothetical protein
VVPTTAPEEDATVTSCPTGDMLVKSIAIGPELALSEVVLYFSWPSGLAERLSFWTLAAAGVDDVAALEVVGVVAAVGVEADELVLLDELPHPVRASSPTARVSIEAFGTDDIFA